MMTTIIYMKETWVLDDSGWHSPYETLVWKGNAHQSSTPKKEADGLNQTTNQTMRNKE